MSSFKRDAKVVIFTLACVLGIAVAIPSQASTPTRIWDLRGEESLSAEAAVLARQLDALEPLDDELVLLSLEDLVEFCPKEEPFELVEVPSHD